jgi:sulfhydrogenase subunit beta (sulfur reductase)
MRRLYVSDVSSLEGLFNSLAKEKVLYAPTSTGAQSEFSRVNSLTSANLDLVNVTKSPKFQLLPQTVEMFAYDPRSGSTSSTPEMDVDAMFFGVRPCDASAIGVLDSVLLGSRFEDPYYASRRHRSLIVSVACERQAQSCFCRDLGTGPVEGTGGDIALLRVDDVYYAKPVSAKGLDFLRLYQSVFKPASDGDASSYERKRSELEGTMGSKLKVDALTKKLRDVYESQLWPSVSERCIGCGICSFFCPTCYCFDTIDEYRSGLCRRMRGWDSCSYCDFSRMAGGLDPRPTKDRRFRHRVFHKWSYVLEAFGVNACVGCGRCISLCPVNIDIREVLTSL